MEMLYQASILRTAISTFADLTTRSLEDLHLSEFYSKKKAKVKLQKSVNDRAPVQLKATYGLQLLQQICSFKYRNEFMVNNLAEMNQVENIPEETIEVTHSQNDLKIFTKKYENTMMESNNLNAHKIDKKFLKLEKSLNNNNNNYWK